MFLQLHILADIKVIADILLTLLEQVIEKQNFSHNKKKKISIPFFFFFNEFCGVSVLFITYEKLVQPSKRSVLKTTWSTTLFEMLMAH